MSSYLFPQILFLIGLNFINVLCLGAKTGPSFRYSEKLEGVPDRIFYDILKDRETIWLAGEGLFKLTKGNLVEEVLENARITSIALEEDSGYLWYSGSDGINRLNPTTLKSEKVSGEFDYIWELIWFDEKVWFIESERFGWLNDSDMSIGEEWAGNFLPRPCVSLTKSPERLFVGSAEGLWELGKSGKVLQISAEKVDGEIIPWINRMGADYFLGTSREIYRWSGSPTEDLVHIPSNYGLFFKSGINNALSVGDQIAVTQYPTGVALWNTEKESILEVVPNEATEGIGDVFKIVREGSDSLYMLGESGVAIVDVSIQSKFYPAEELFGNDEVRGMVSTSDRGHVFTEDQWFEISDTGYVSEGINFPPDWVDIDNNDNLVCGSVTAYEIMEHGNERLQELPAGVFDLKWGKDHAYALGGEGIYQVSDKLEMELIYPEKRQLELLGENGDNFYAMSGDGSVIRLNKSETDWKGTSLPERIEGNFLDADSNAEGVWVATSDLLYQINDDKMQSHEVATGWKILSLSATESHVAVLYEQPNQREWAVGIYEAGQHYMLAVPYKDYIGEPISIMSSMDRIGVIGKNGLGWYHRKEMPEVSQPGVDFDLLFENKRIEDRTIPAGMHFIDLDVSFSEPAVPSVVQFRINENRWRNVNLQDPSLQFAGHGTFSVELRAVHPNGNVSPSKLIQFGIAPPWYLNPIYQGIMVLLTIVFAWLLYYLRSRQLKRTNLWLQNEVKKQTRELEAASAARTNFLAGLSHDIRNPLNGVLMIAETLSRKPPVSGDDPRLKDLTEFGIIVDRMLGEILDFSAIDQENIPTAFIPVSLNDIIESSVKQNQFSIQHEMVTLETSIPDELKEVIIRTDRNWMIKVLSNLIVNALEYSESSRVEIGARCLRLTEQEVQLELIVTDWGVGIDDSEKDFVFERFYRGESGIESGKHGTGLGLSICQEIAHAIGGHIRIEDNDPSGCKFVLTGRFDRVEGAHDLDKEAVLSKLANKRILIVDDLVYNRRSIVEFFETLGCTCDQAENGREALALLEQNDYYLALLDWDLPGIMGPEIARRYRSKSPDDRVLLVSVTAYTDGEKKRESEEAGMNGYISKPLTAARLAHCLANIENYQPELRSNPDVVDFDEVQEEIYKHIEECLHYGEHYEWENLRRCAHRLTTLALIKNNRPMQQVCRDLQIAATESNIKESQVELLELRKWRKS